MPHSEGTCWSLRPATTRAGGCSAPRANDCNTKRHATKHTQGSIRPAIGPRLAWPKKNKRAVVAYRPLGLGAVGVERKVDQLGLLQNQSFLLLLLLLVRSSGWRHLQELHHGLDVAHLVEPPSCSVSSGRVRLGVAALEDLARRLRRGPRGTRRRPSEAPAVSVTPVRPQSARAKPFLPLWSTLAGRQAY